MESKTENLVKVCEERNYVHCITEGIRQAWNNSGNLMHYIWPALVVCAALSALTGLVTQRLVSEATSWMLIVSLVACLLSILGWLFFVATMDAMLVRWRDLDYEPVVTMKTLRSLIGQRMKRDFNVLILLFLLFVLSYAAGYFLVVFHSSLGPGCWIADGFAVARAHGYDCHGDQVQRQTAGSMPCWLHQGLALLWPHSGIRPRGTHSDAAGLVGGSLAHDGDCYGQSGGC